MNKLRGFSLIELMVVVAVVALIGAVAWPWFERIQQSVYRAECISAMKIAAADMDNCASAQGNNYWAVRPGFVNCAIRPSSDLTPIGGGVFASRTGRCRITVVPANAGIPAPGGTGFLVRSVLAGPENANNQDIISNDKLCGTLTLTETGVRDALGGDRDVTYCWGSN